MQEEIENKINSIYICFGGKHNNIKLTYKLEYLSRLLSECESIIEEKKWNNLIMKLTTKSNKFRN